MAQIAQSPSGIEIYTRKSDLPSRAVTDLQDQYPTAIRQDEYPTAWNVVSPPYHATAATQAAAESTTGENGGSLRKSAGELKVNKKNSRRCGVSRLTFWLGLIVGVLIVVVAVVGGVLGSRIGKEVESKSSNPSPIPIISPTSVSFCSPISPSSSAVPTSTPFASLPIPANDCSAFGTPFSIDVSVNKTERNPWANASFGIYCKTDYIKGDITSFYASSLLTCMNGCAAFNYWQDYNGNLAKMNCSGVVYSLDFRPYGNCYLKRGGFVTRMTRSEVGSYEMLKSNSIS